MRAGTLSGEGWSKLAALAVALFALALLAGPADGVDDPCVRCELNSPPTVSANNESVTVNERQTATNAGIFEDAEGDPVTLTASVGSITKDNANGTWNWSFPTNDGPDQSQTVTITASDGKMTTSTTFELTVNNVAPTTVWEVPSPVQVNESDDPSVLSLVVREPGEDGPPTLNTSCSAVFWGGSFNGSFYSFSYFVFCPRGDGPLSSTVTARATDSDGATGNTASLDFEVRNVSPTGTLNVPASINEGGTATISFTNQNDVQADRNAGFHYAFDCNGGSLTGATYANSGTGASTACAYDDNRPLTDKGTPAPYTVRARIIDKDNGFTEYTKSITVNNVAPTATLEAPASAAQGNNFTVSLTNPSDPSSADRESLTYAFDCGNGYGEASSQASRSCLAPDRPNMTVKGKVLDKDGGVNEYTREVTIGNVAPTGTVRVNNNAVATNSRTVNLTLSATDPLPGSGVGHMRFRNENTETWSEWEPYATSRQWLLSEGDGAKTVHVQYRDNAGNVSQSAISGGIRLDTVVPAGGVKINNGAARTTSLKVRLALRATDGLEGSGVSQMCVSNTQSCAAWRPYSTGLSWKLAGKKAGTKTVYVRYRDRAGNVSALYRDTIRYAPRR